MKIEEKDYNFVLNFIKKQQTSVNEIRNEYCKINNFSNTFYRSYIAQICEKLLNENLIIGNEYNYEIK